MGEGDGPSVILVIPSKTNERKLSSWPQEASQIILHGPPKGGQFDSLLGVFWAPKNKFNVKIKG